jgi:small conductance mechanosensitive channel
MTNMMVSFNDFFDADWQTIALRAGRIVLILIVAFILSRLVRRAIRKLALRLAERQEKKRAEEDGRVDKDEDDESLRDKLADFVPDDILPGPASGERAAQRAKTLGTIGASVFNIIIWLIAIMLVLSELGINLGPILAGAGIIGIALGFGAQSLVKDYLSGILIIIEDQYGVGDIVDVGEASGIVEEVTLRSTRIRGLDGTMWHVPNGEIRRSGNLSHYWSRVILDVPIAYDADIGAASKLIKSVADEVWHEHEDAEILEEPQIWGVEELGDNSIAIRLVVKTMPATQWQIARELRGRIKEAFDREGFEIPFPQRTVWLRQQ